MFTAFDEGFLDTKKMFLAFDEGFLGTEKMFIAFDEGFLGVVSPLQERDVQYRAQMKGKSGMKKGYG